MQSRRLRRLALGAGIAPDRIWWEHFRRGGDVGAVEVDAYLHQCLWLLLAERDLLAGAAEAIAARGTAAGSPSPWSASESDGTPDSEVSVDLHEAHLAETEAVDLLRRSLDDARPATGPVRIVVPDAPADHPAPGHHRLWAPGTYPPDSGADGHPVTRPR